MQKWVGVIFCLYLIFVNPDFSFAQREVDSMKALIETVPDDSLKVDLLNNLSKELWTSEHQEDVLAYGLKAKILAEKLHYQKGLALAFKNIGRGYFNQGKYLEALQYYENSLSVFESIGDKNGMANMNMNLGNIYYNKGDEESAQDYFVKSLKLSEEINDTLRILSALGNIGAVYTNKRATYDQALQYLLRAYPLSIAIHENNATGSITANIGEVYYKKFEADTTQKELLDSAHHYFNLSLEAYGDDVDASYTLNYVGRLYMEERNFKEAIEYQKKAYAIAEKAEARNDMAIALIALAETYMQQGKKKAALDAYKQAESLSIDAESKYNLKDVYDGLSGLYGDMGDLKNAFKYQRLLIAIKDTIYDIETDKKLGTVLFGYQIEKKQGEVDLLTKDQELKQEEISRQKIVRNSFIGGFAVMLLFAGVFFTQRNRISKEKKRSEELLLNILPEDTAEELKLTGKAKTKSYESVTVMFTDFKGFTMVSEKLTPEELVNEINYCFSEYDRIISRHGIEKIKTIGDAYMCAGGLPQPNGTHAVDVVKAGLEIQQFMARMKEDRLSKGQKCFELRLGIHSGPVVAGIVGIKKFAYDIWGDTVNTASRIESSGEVAKVNISESTYDLVKDRFQCVHRGKVKAKNKGDIDMYFVESAL